jgi:hypothetical protein
MITHEAQRLLFPDLLADRRAAIEADVAAAGGLQKVGELLGLADNAVDAGKLLSNKIQRNGRHDLKDEEVWRIKELARKSPAGKSRLHEIESGALSYDGRWLTSDDIKARKRKRKAALLAELIELESEDE